MDKIEKIRQEIKRRMNTILGVEGLVTGVADNMRYQGYKSLLAFLDTLSEEPDKSLEEEIQRYLSEECSDDEEPTVSEIAHHFAEWQYQKDRGEFAKIKAKTWCEGFDAHKEQMMKDAMEAEVQYFGETQGVPRTIKIPRMQEWLRPFKDGDKVRIVILKAEEEEV